MFVIIWKLFATHSACVSACATVKLLSTTTKTNLSTRCTGKFIFKLIENFSTFLFRLIGVSANLSGECCTWNSVCLGRCYFKVWRTNLAGVTNQPLYSELIFSFGLQCEGCVWGLCIRMLRDINEIWDLKSLVWLETMYRRFQFR